jgi:hypothetical protein
MVGARAAILAGPVAEAIEQTVEAIESAVDRVPDFAFDLSKTLIESVCKTVLADIGQPADPGWDCPRLLRETTNRLSMLPRNHPDAANARGSIEKTIRGLLQTVQGLCELRNNYGIASHGRDGFAARLDVRQATLAAQAADTIVSFLYRIHRDTSSDSPGARVYYEDHETFNQAFDAANEVVVLGESRLQPSFVLFRADPEAYKAALLGFLTEPPDWEELREAAPSDWVGRELVEPDNLGDWGGWLSQFDASLQDAFTSLRADDVLLAESMADDYLLVCDREGFPIPDAPEDAHSAGPEEPLRHAITAEFIELLREWKQAWLVTRRENGDEQ